MVLNGAEDETRTRDIHLGKVALYQLSHFRILSIVPHGEPRLLSLERKTRLELATSTLARWRSTN